MQSLAELIANIEPVPPPPPKSKKRFVVTLPKRNKEQNTSLIGELVGVSKAGLAGILGISPNMDIRDESKIDHGWIVLVNGATFVFRDWKGSWRNDNYMVEGDRATVSLMTGMFGQYFKGTV